MFDFLGNFLRLTPNFRGKWRLVLFWSNRLRPDSRIGRLPNGLKIITRMDVPYERMVWLNAEETIDLKSIKKFLKEGDLFIDVGSNIGLYTLTCASVCNVIAMEPNPATFAKLEKNVALNNLSKKVRLIQSAVSSKLGFIRFHCDPQHNISSVVVGTSPGIEVPTITLDSFAPTIDPNRRVIIKIDAEGHEDNVILGCLQLIKKTNPFFIIEFNTDLTSSKNIRNWETFSILTELGYSAQEFGVNKPHQINSEYSINGYKNIFFFKS